MMDKNYKTYECPVCGCEFAIYQVTAKVGRYVTCPMDGRHKAHETGEYESLSECMEHARYKRNKRGAVEQE